MEFPAEREPSGIIIPGSIVSAWRGAEYRMDEILMNIHTDLCKKKSNLGSSEHGLVVAKKDEGEFYGNRMIQRGSDPINGMGGVQHG